MSKQQTVFGLAPFNPPGTNMFLFARDDDPGSGSGNRRSRRNREENDDDDDNDRPPTPSPIVTAAKYGNDTAQMAGHINTLESENFKLRKKNRTLRETIEDYEDKLPEGSVVVSKKDADLLESYKKLGDPKELETKVGKVGTLEEENKKTSKAALFTKISSKPVKGKNLSQSVLEDLDSRRSDIDSYFEKEVTLEDGTKEKQWFLKQKKGEGTSATLEEFNVLDFYLKEYPTYERSLVLVGEEDDQTPGTPYPEQLPKGDQTAPKASIATTHLNTRYGHNLPEKK